MTATGSRPDSSRGCPTVNAADSSSEASTSASPRTVAPPPGAPAVTSPTPHADSAKPAQATGRATVRCQTAAATATITGTAPISSAACVTLVLVMPAFCTTSAPPYPTAPEASAAGVSASRTRCRDAAGSSTAAARPNLAAASQPGAIHCSASLDSGTVVPHSSPAAVSAATALRRLVLIRPCSPRGAQNWPLPQTHEIKFCNMAISFDEIDLRLLDALQADADRTNVELARLTGLSPAATLHRVRRLKASGVIRIVAARLDPAAAGFPLQVYVTATLARHDPRSTRVFEDQVRALPQVIAADNVAGETDYLLSAVARDVADLQEVLARLATRGGQRLVTYLRLAEVKPPSPLPLAAPAATPPPAR